MRERTAEYLVSARVTGFTNAEEEEVA